MSLSNTTVGTTYACNGATTTFAIPFAWTETSEIKVYKITIATGVATLLTLTTDYTFTPNDTNPTSIITNSAYASTFRVRLERTTALQQTVDYMNNSGFLAEDHEEALDKIVQMIQEVRLLADNSLRVSKSNYGVTTELSPLLVAGAAVVVNATADGFELGDAVPDISLINAAIAQAQASAAAAAASEANAATSAASLGQVALTVVGTRAAPTAVVAGTGVVFTSITNETINFVEGSGGAVTVSANPQIQAGTINGQRLMLIGRNDTNTITLNDGTGLNTGGLTLLLKAGTVVEFVWDGTEWTISSTNGLM